MNENTDNLFQRMCLAAKELQEKLYHKGSSIGAKIILKDGKKGTVVYVNSWDGSFHIATYSEQWGWAEGEKRRTQDDGYWHIFSLDQLWAWWIQGCYGKNYREGCHNLLDRVSLSSITFELRGALLIGIMGRDHQKRWTGEAWIEIEKEAKNVDRAESCDGDVVR